MTGFVKPLTWILGVTLLSAGVHGFFQNPALGLFEINTLHNIIHLSSGALGVVAASMGVAYSRTFLIVFGLVYGLVTVIGFIQGNTVLGLIPINLADNLLHLGITATSLVVGFGSKR